MTTRSPAELMGRLRGPAYLILALSTLLPLMDLGSAIWPLHPATSVWRFGSFGLFAEAAPGLVLGLLFLSVVAAVADDRRVLLALGIVAALEALVMLGGSVTFGLDALQTRTHIQAAVLHRFDLTSGRAVVKLVVLGLANAWLARADIKAAGRVRRKAEEKAAAPAPLLNRPEMLGARGASARAG